MGYVTFKVILRQRTVAQAWEGFTWHFPFLVADLLDLPTRSTHASEFLFRVPWTLVHKKNSRNLWVMFFIRVFQFLTSDITRHIYQMTHLDTYRAFYIDPRPACAAQGRRAGCQIRSLPQKRDNSLNIQVNSNESGQNTNIPKNNILFSVCDRRPKFMSTDGPEVCP